MPAMATDRHDSDFAGWLRHLRRQLHADPELGLELPRTQEKVLIALDEASAPLRIVLGRSCTSVVAVLEGARPGPAVLLRADMDALPVTEQTGLPYRSRIPDTMHACGHDLHTAMLVGAAHMLSERRGELAGSVVFMFQPGEEGFDGAARMLDDGVLDIVGDRPIAAYALHVMSALFPHGRFATRPGPLMAAADAAYVTVRGAGGHGSAPNLARDPIPAACAMVTALQTIVSRRVDPFSPAVVTVGQFHAGTKRTIIPDTAKFEVTIRTVDEETREAVMEGIREICTNVALAHRVVAEVSTAAEFPLTVNDQAESQFATSTVAEVFGEERPLVMPHPVMGSEDFSRVLSAVPGAMVFMGACPPERDHTRAPYNHAPDALFDDATVPDGAELYAELALRRLRVG